MPCSSVLLRSLLTGTLLSALLAPSAAASTEWSRQYLVRPSSDVPDLDAKGWVRVFSNEDAGRERIDVRIQRVAASDVVSLLLEDPEKRGSFTVIGELAGKANKKLLIDTKKGDALPYGVESGFDLAGLRVILALGAEPDVEDPIVLLTGVMPEFVEANKTLTGKDNLDVHPDSPHKPTANGEIRIRANDKGGLQRILIKVKGVGFQSFNYRVFMDDGEGTMVEVAPLTQYAKRKGRFIRNTRQGDPLPFDELFLNALLERKIEIRDQVGTVHLQEFVPLLN